MTAPHDLANHFTVKQIELINDLRARYHQHEPITRTADELTDNLVKIVRYYRQQEWIRERVKRGEISEMAASMMHSFLSTSLTQLASTVDHDAYVFNALIAHVEFGGEAIEA